MIQYGMELQTSTVLPLKFGSGNLISSHTLYWIEYNYSSMSDQNQTMLVIAGPGWTIVYVSTLTTKDCCGAKFVVTGRAG